MTISTRVCLSLVDPPKWLRVSSRFPFKTDLQRVPIQQKNGQTHQNRPTEVSNPLQPTRQTTEQIRHLGKKLSPPAPRLGRVGEAHRGQRLALCPSIGVSLTDDFRHSEAGSAKRIEPASRREAVGKWAPPRFFLGGHPLLLLSFEGAPKGKSPIFYFYFFFGGGPLKKHASQVFFEEKDAGMTIVLSCFLLPQKAGRPVVAIA